MWMPPFTLTGDIDLNTQDLMVVIGFIVFCMTPSVVKMAQEWLQIKESPYASEAFSGFVGIASAPVKGGISMGKRRWELNEQRKLFSNIGKSENNPTPTG
jgi:hypothetical protein